MPKKKRTRSDQAQARSAICQRAEKALRELHLSSFTQADKDRLYRVERALHALDDEQAELKLELEETLKAFEKDGAVNALAAKIRALVVPVNPEAEDRKAREIFG